MNIRILALSFLCACPMVASAAVYDVSTTAELREALATAATAGGDNTIRLAAGTYSTQDDGGGTLVYLSNLEGSLKLLGDSTDDVILSGDTVDAILQFNPISTSDLTLSNLTFREGNCAVQLVSDRPVGEITVNRAIFVNNTCSVDGAALSRDSRSEGGRLIISSSTFRDNQARDGGAIAATFSEIEISNTDFIANRSTRPRVSYSTASAGGALQLNFYSSLSITNSNFNSNSGLNDGGAIYAFGVGGVTGTISGNSFRSNDARNGGAAYLTGYTDTSYYIEQNEFYLNSSSQNGGAIWGYNLSLVNNLLVDNDSDGGSSSVYLKPYSKFSEFSKLSNNLLLNSPVFLGHDSTVTNNIFIGDGVQIDAADSQVVLNLNNNHINSSLIDSDIVFGSNNVFDGVNLGFVNAEEGDYRLTSSSGLIDAGTTDPELAYITDYDYTRTTARVIGASIDIGPYEYDGEAPPDNDGDGLNDNIDNCPSIANEDQADNDSDGEGDACDTDDDNDGVADTADAFPFDATESLDTDGDRLGNNKDQDDDADGILDSFDYQPLVANTIIVDSDGDGYPDSIDDFPGDASRQISNNGDFDGDGYTNEEEVDYCSNPLDANSQPSRGGLSPAMIKAAVDSQGG